jgi:glycosyltransferase involved in cell wall biosynthesis
MKICMILHDPQPFGGLEEYAATLAIGLKERGQQVSVLSTTWVSKDNQYLRRLLANGVTYVQVPKWLSRPASHWETKQKILKAILWIASPLILLLAFGLLFKRRIGLRQAWTSAHGWLRGQIQRRYFVHNRYQPLMLLLLEWWRLRWRPDLLHIQGYTTSLLFVIEWAHKRKIPVVYEEHQTPDARFNWWQGFEKSINKSTRVVAVSEKSAEALREVCGVTRPIVVRNPLLPDPLVSGWHRNNGNNNRARALRITTVARLVEAKGLAYLLDAAALIRKTHPKVEFRIFGEGELREELLAKAERLGLDGDSIFQGAFTNRKELDNIMARTDIFVLSSVLEGQPLGVVEAMAYGCPIVTTAVGGIPELIQDGVNGLLCPPRDPDCLAEKIKTLVEDPALRERLGRAARQSYEQGPFQPAAVTQHFISVYQDALREGIPA